MLSGGPSWRAGSRWSARLVSQPTGRNLFPWLSPGKWGCVSARPSYCTVPPGNEAGNRKSRVRGAPRKAAHQVVQCQAGKDERCHALGAIRHCLRTLTRRSRTSVVILAVRLVALSYRRGRLSTGPCGKRPFTCGPERRGRVGRSPARSEEWAWRNSAWSSRAQAYGYPAGCEECRLSVDQSARAGSRLSHVHPNLRNISTLPSGRGTAWHLT